MYLGKATAATRTMLSSPTRVYSAVLVSAWVKLQQLKEQCYPCLPMYTVVSIFLGKVAAATRTMLSSPPSVYSAVLVFTWVKLQQLKEQCCPCLPMCTVEF